MKVKWLIWLYVAILLYVTVPLMSMGSGLYDPFTKNITVSERCHPFIYQHEMGHKLWWEKVGLVKGYTIRLITFGLYDEIQADMFGFKAYPVVGQKWIIAHIMLYGGLAITVILTISRIIKEVK